MRTRLRAPVVRRSSLPLTERDEHDLALLRSSAPQRAALGRLSGEPLAPADLSEAALLHAVFEAGLAAVREASEDAAYAELAAQQADEDTARRTEARRRRPSWATDQ